MSFKPTFEIGLWNAWILALFIVLHPFLMTLVDKLFGAGDFNQKMGGEPPNGKK